MSTEKVITNHQTMPEPESWRPSGAYDVIEIGQQRKNHNAAWIHAARIRNQNRPLYKKLILKGKVSHREMMLNDAYVDNEAIDRGELSATMKAQRMGDAFLRLSGVDPKHIFHNSSELHEQLDSDASTRRQRWDKVSGIANDEKDKALGEEAMAQQDLKAEWAAFLKTLPVTEGHANH